MIVVCGQTLHMVLGDVEEVKSADSGTAVSTYCIQADFYLGASAIPLPNDISDLRAPKNPSNDLPS